MVQPKGVGTLSLQSQSRGGCFPAKPQKARRSRSRHVERNLKKYVSKALATNFPGERSWAYWF